MSRMPDTTSKFQLFLVGIDAPTWPAVADPEDRWNGFLGSPWFDRGTLRDMANMLNDDDTHITVDDEGAWLAHADYADEYDDPRGELSPWNTSIDGVPRATVGAWSWCWNEWPPTVKDTLIVEVEGGVVRGTRMASGKPIPVNIVVHDYDIDGVIDAERPIYSDGLGGRFVVVEVSD